MKKNQIKLFNGHRRNTLAVKTNRRIKRNGFKPWMAGYPKLEQSTKK